MVMHDTCIVVTIAQCVGFINLCLFKITFMADPDIFSDNGDILVSVRSCVLMVESNDMSKFVHSY